MSALRLRARDFDGFFSVPFRQYPAACPTTSPLRSELRKMLDGAANPVFTGPDDITYFTALRGDEAVGRITAHVHRAANERYGLRRGSFGFFDCTDEGEVARILLDAASDWLRERGCDEIVGNFNLTAMQEMGVVIDGHEHAPFLAQQHNPAWIPALLRENGFEGLFPMTSWHLDLRAVKPADLLGPRQRALLDDGHLRLSAVGRRRFRSSMEVTRALLNSSFAQNPLFVPLTEAEFRFQAEAMLSIYDPRISFLAHLDDQACGVIVCLPDVYPLLRATRSRIGWTTPLHYLRYRARRTRASLIFGGVVPEMQNRGLAGLLLYHALSAMQRAGYTDLGITWISDTNPSSLRQMEKIGAEPLHRLALFRRSI
ncbi:MAG: GNAT family N-acetyltransferase [Gemmatimonadota bacterium]